MKQDFSMILPFPIIIKIIKIQAWKFILVENFQGSKIT